MITGIYEFGFFFVQKWPFRDAHLLFKKKALKPLFLQCFWGARFLGQVVKIGKFWTPTQKRRKNSLITEKLIFEYFLCFLVFFSFFFFFCFFVCFVFFLCCFGGFKGHVRWPEGPPHLALNPPYLFFVLFLFCFFLGGFLLFFWRV